MRSTVLLDTSKSSREREVMNALNKGKALTGFLTFLDIRGSSTRVIAIGNQPSVVPLLTDLLPAQRGGNSSDPAWSHGINEGKDEKKIKIKVLSGCPASVLFVSSLQRQRGGRELNGQYSLKYRRNKKRGGIEEE